MDCSAEFQEQVRTAAAAGTPLFPRGGGSKSFLGAPVPGAVFAVGGHTGIVDYQPTEQVLTARSGTRLEAIEDTLARENQMLGFEPPHYGPGATLGGSLACGLSGPRRPHAGAARDFVLGIRVINGRGEHLRFGGRVMKNVAGYDVARLMVGAMGTLGLITEASIRVLPRPAREVTLVQECAAGKGPGRLWELACAALPISATLADGERIYLRLSGTGAAVDSARRSTGGEVLEDTSFWPRLREHHHPFFAGPEPLWRLSLPATAEPLPLPGDWLLEWGGALRWLRSPAEADTIHRAAARAGGHAIRYTHDGPSAGNRQALDPGLVELHRRTRLAFDPAGIFNPRRYYRDF